MLTSTGSRITKRPLLHPPVAAPRTGSSNPKIVYVSASSPFISTVKRVRSYLSEIEKRSSTSTAKIDLLGSATDREKLNRIISEPEDQGSKGEAVMVKATGKAIEKALQIALYFQGQNDCEITLKTGSVGAVDDFEEGGVEGSRVRRTSMLEVGIKLKS